MPAFDIPLNELLAPNDDRMPAVLSRYRADGDALERRFATPFSLIGRERLAAFDAAWCAALDEMPFDGFTRPDRLDFLLFRNYLERRAEQRARETEQFAEMAPLLPFAADLIALDEARRDHVVLPSDQVAHRLDVAAKQVKAAQEAAEKAGEGGEAGAVRPTVARRAMEALRQLKEMLGEWYGFRTGYDPVFTWWCERPYKKLEEGLDGYRDALRKRFLGEEGNDTIVGDPIGRTALEDELRRAFLPYGPEELIARAETERQWCLERLREASREMGLGGDPRAAIEAVKAEHVPPGEQPGLVRDLAVEAIRWVEERDLLTVPEIARDGWRMSMVSPERQKVNPFFLGGEQIQVSFPTADMDHDQKRMSLRGNNRHFARATVQHELIPGHYLQVWAMERYRPYRRFPWTPFWVEGWTLHWEMLLWDLGFPRTPEERVGMLFWRLHRCARVLFSLRFHLGEMSPAECVALLTDEVGHERENAVAEVRRSFEGGYDPLYQCAYLIGGFQVRALYQEATSAGGMTPRQFHDAFLRQNCLPIAALRAYLLNLPLEKDTRLGDWRF